MDGRWNVRLSDGLKMELSMSTIVACLVAESSDLQASSVSTTVLSVPVVSVLESPLLDPDIACGIEDAPFTPLAELVADMVISLDGLNSQTVSTFNTDGGCTKNSSLRKGILQGLRCGGEMLIDARLGDKSF